MNKITINNCEYSIKWFKNAMERANRSNTTKFKREKDKNKQGGKK